MVNLQRHKQAGGGENDQPENDGFGRGGAGIGFKDLQTTQTSLEDIFVDLVKGGR